MSKTFRIFAPRFRKSPPPYPIITAPPYRPNPPNHQKINPPCSLHLSPQAALPTAAQNTNNNQNDPPPPKAPHPTMSPFSKSLPQLSLLPPESAAVRRSPRRSLPLPPCVMPPKSPT